MESEIRVNDDLIDSLEEGDSLFKYQAVSDSKNEDSKSTHRKPHLVKSNILLFNEPVHE